jgi:EmrB/QacA subfamily drug resistance transporter
MERIKKLFNVHEGVPDSVYKKRWWILGVLCLSLLIVMIGNTSLNVALPTLSKELGATNSQLQWLVDSYSLVFAGFLFMAGALGDRFGRKGILQLGLGLFAGAALYAALGVNTANQLIIARAVMGLAGAMIMPATLSILTNVFPPKERAKAVALWAGVSGGGTAFGPLLSGFVLEHFSWHSVFLLNIPLILIALIAGAILLPRTADPNHTKLDIPGSMLSVVGLVAIVYAIIEGPHHGWLSSQTLITLAGGFVAMAAFVWWQLRSKHPMLDVRLFKKPAFGISSLVLILVFFALMGMFFNMSQLMQLVYGYAPMEAAIRMLPMSFAIVVASIASPKLVARFGKRRVVASGMLIVAAGVLLLSTLGTDPQYGRLLLSMCIAALGMGISMSPTTDLLMSAVPRSRAGMGSAMNDTTRELGGSLGVAILGSLLASKYGGQIAETTAKLPDAARTAAENSLAGALAVAEKLPAQLSEVLAEAAKSAWMSGFKFSLVIGAVIIAASSLIAFLWLPDKSEDVVEEEGLFEDEAAA